MTESSYEPADPDLTPEPILRGGFDITTESGARFHLADLATARANQLRDAHDTAVDLIEKLRNTSYGLASGHDANVLGLVTSPWDSTYGEALPDLGKITQRVRRIAADTLTLAAADEAFAHRLGVEGREHLPLDATNPVPTRAEQRAALSAQEADVDEWNDAHSPETSVRYWPGDRVGDGKTGQTIGCAFLMGNHTAVVRVANSETGAQDFIALTHVQAITDEERDR